MAEEIERAITGMKLNFTIMQEEFRKEKEAFGDAVQAAIANCNNK